MVLNQNRSNLAWSKYKFYEKYVFTYLMLTLLHNFHHMYL
jgi:hypothetical protein